MTPSAPSVSRFQALAAQWRVLGLLAVAFARHVSLSHKMRARGGAREAAMLEAWVYCALTRLAGQIAVLCEHGAPTCAEDARALDYLKSIHMWLSILALFLTQMRRELEEAGGAPDALMQRLVAESGQPPCALEPAPAFLDSS